ncbi:MAG TPA: hypothetical protein VMV12_08225, partial [Candidatus Micrarchaeaceae archaeon]|nr:hypothetical protein [Candidatus Micrarchaeaceae archaeon]
EVLAGATVPVAVEGLEERHRFSCLGHHQVEVLEGQGWGRQGATSSGRTLRWELAWNRLSCIGLLA